MESDLCDTLLWRADDKNRYTAVPYRKHKIKKDNMCVKFVHDEFIHCLRDAGAQCCFQLRPVTMR